MYSQQTFIKKLTDCVHVMKKLLYIHAICQIGKCIYVYYSWTPRALYTMQGLSDDLKRSPDTLEDLKFVLSVIAKIRVMSLDVELQYRYVLQAIGLSKHEDNPVNASLPQRCPGAVPDSGNV